MAEFGFGWGGRIRTSECRFQRPVSYHLTTPQRFSPKTPRFPFGTGADSEYEFESIEALPNLQQKLR
jgi:hypothetical protein